MSKANIESLNPHNEFGVPNTNFPGEPQWDIPWLREDLQADYLDMPCVAWGSKSRTKKSGIGTYHFYVEDYRFNGIWKKPHQVPESGCPTAVEVNYTISLTSPRATILQKIFQKRWLSRYWQEEGVRIFVDMNVPLEFNHLNLLGVPQGWRSYATHGYSDRVFNLYDEYEAACFHAGSHDILWVVYGGGKVIKEVCQKEKWYWIPEQSDMDRGRISPPMTGGVVTYERTPEKVVQTQGVGLI